MDHIHTIHCINIQSLVNTDTFLLVMLYITVKFLQSPLVAIGDVHPWLLPVPSTSSPSSFMQSSWTTKACRYGGLILLSLFTLLCYNNECVHLVVDQNAQLLVQCSKELSRHSVERKVTGSSSLLISQLHYSCTYQSKYTLYSRVYSRV